VFSDESRQNASNDSESQVCTAAVGLVCIILQKYKKTVIDKHSLLFREYRNEMQNTHSDIKIFLSFYVLTKRSMLPVSIHRLL